MTRVSLALSITLGLMVSSCAIPTARHEWQSFESKDPFSDDSWCDVSFAGKLVDNGWLGTNASQAFTATGLLYPVVRILGADYVFAITTASVVPGQTSIAMPVGDVQIRIDRNPAHTLLASQTPIEVNESYKQFFQTQAESMAMTSEQQAAYLTSTEGAMKSLAPVTAVGGDQAKQIVEEMRTGTKLIYRQTTTGMTGAIAEIPLEGFREQLAACEP